MWTSMHNGHYGKIADLPDNVASDEGQTEAEKHGSVVYFITMLLFILCIYTVAHFTIILVYF